jgi:hypothetical protein
LPQIKKLPNSILISHWVQKLANALGVSVESISEELKKLPNAEQSRTIQTQENSSVLRPSEKNRQQLLEEKILSLTLMSPELMDFIDQDDINLFSPQFKIALTCLKEKKDIKDLEGDYFFQAEINETQDPEQEIQVCLECFRRVAWQDQLKKYGDELKLAERVGDPTKRKEIIDKINFLTKHRPA